MTSSKKVWWKGLWCSLCIHRLISNPRQDQRLEWEYYTLLFTFGIHAYIFTLLKTSVAKSSFFYTDFVCLACNNKKQVCVEVENVTYKNEDEEGSLEKKGRNGNPLQVFMSCVMCDFGTFIIFKWNWNGVSCSVWDFVWDANTVSKLRHNITPYFYIFFILFLSGWNLNLSTVKEKKQRKMNGENTR